MGIQEKFLENTDEQAAVFSALADPTRLKLVKLLCRQRDPDALCVNALAGFLGVSQRQLDRVNAPIGIEIGAETPQEIAISILAEIIKVKRIKSAKGRRA